MKDAHVRLIFYYCYFKLPEEPSPTFSVLALHKSKCKWHDLIVAVLTNGGQDLSPILASKKSTINTDHWSTVSESFYAYTEREEHTMQHLYVWKLCHPKVFDVNICAWITGLQCVEEPNN
jgi:hypothetical protein